MAILGTRYRDFSIEEEQLGPLGATLISGPGGSPADILEVARGATVILAGSRPRFTAEVLAGLSCRGIVRYGVGTDSIDLEAAHRLGIAVARVSDYGTEAVAFHAVSMAVAQLRRLNEVDRSIRSGRWGFGEVRPLHEPSTLAAGVIGYGRIGRQSAAYLKALGMRVSAYDPYADIPADHDVADVSLEELLATTDVVLLHAAGRPDGRPLLDAKALGRMRPGSILVNTARGSLIDFATLVEALRAGRPARAALDVFPTEPPDLSALSDVADKVLLSPHMAWYTEESEADMRQKAAAEAARLLQGEPLADPVVEIGQLA
ncbi:C-terminal binding protein [Georgenia yuyongxinii]|uniref:C-terminal binding protein n=1 Tax=Georgenia yuyongxinii TaxID=2589797 RepID=UPI00143CFABA|nr:C-terminal binding protein [Georgenia yuyongxinii]